MNIRLSPFARIQTFILWPIFAARRIGLPRQDGQRVDFARAMSLRGIETGLGIAGLHLADSELVDITSDQPTFAVAAGVANGRFHELEAAALARGEVDAIYVKGAPGLGTVGTHGLRSLINLAEQDDPLLRVNNGNPRPVTVDRRTALERPDLVARYLAVLLRASHWAQGHPAEVFDIIGKEVGRSADEARAAYGSAAPRSFGLDLSDVRKRAWQARRISCCATASSSGISTWPAGSTRSLLALAHELLR